MTITGRSTGLAGLPAISRNEPNAPAEMLSEAMAAIKLIPPARSAGGAKWPGLPDVTRRNETGRKAGSLSFRSNLNCAFIAVPMPLCMIFTPALRLMRISCNNSDEVSGLLARREILLRASAERYATQSSGSALYDLGDVLWNAGRVNDAVTASAPSARPSP